MQAEFWLLLTRRSPGHAAHSRALPVAQRIVEIVRSGGCVFCSPVLAAPCWCAYEVAMPASAADVAQRPHGLVTRAGCCAKSGHGTCRPGVFCNCARPRRTALLCYVLLIVVGRGAVPGCAVAATHVLRSLSCARQVGCPQVMRAPSRGIQRRSLATRRSHSSVGYSVRLITVRSAVQARVGPFARPSCDQRVLCQTCFGRRRQAAAGATSGGTCADICNAQGAGLASSRCRTLCGAVALQTCPAMARLMRASAGCACGSCMAVLAHTLARARLSAPLRVREVQRCCQR